MTTIDRAARGVCARAPPASPISPWLVTAAATVVSTYALDVVATAAGILLVASQLLAGFDRLAVLSFLAGSYIVWGAGLRVNLQANWALLEATGTSTSLPSKAAYDVARLKSRSVRVRRLAAAVGYAGTELAKETPYYAGASGVALLSDAVSTNEAIVFLGGANLGAAAYEYGLAWLVRTFLRRKDGRAYASFDKDWIPGQYLDDYYRTVEPDERRTIAFFVDAIREAPPDEPILVFGVGPTLHHVFLAAGKASEIHLGDYLPANLREIQRWLERDPGAHDWRPFVRYTLECEGAAAPSAAQVTEREELTRARITRLVAVDLRRDEPLGKGGEATYGTVISAYSADSATADHAIWQAYMRRVAG